MSYAPYCICCGSKAYWSGDWDAQTDYEYDYDGVIGIYVCCNSEKCGIHMEIRDLYISKDIEERSIKYYPDCDEEFKSDCDVKYCLYCNSPLEINHPTSFDKDKCKHEYKVKITECSCPNCKNSYAIEDIYCDENTLEVQQSTDIYDSRKIIVK